MLLLLVDDDKKLLPLLERGFRFEGYDVLTATDGERGITLARLHRPDIMSSNPGKEFVFSQPVRLHIGAATIRRC